jgi:hypothetical protein
MPKERIVLIAVTAIALVCVPFAFLAKPSPRVELHFLGTAPYGQAMAVLFEVRNRPPSFFGVSAVRLEAIDGATWKEFRGGVVMAGVADAPTNFIFSCVIDRQVHAGRLRLVTQYERTLSPLGSFIARVKLRLSGRNNQIPLNPFSKSVALFSNPVEVTTEEFALP